MRVMRQRRAEAQQALVMAPADSANVEHEPMLSEYLTNEERLDDPGPGQEEHTVQAGSPYDPQLPNQLGIEPPDEEILPDREEVERQEQAYVVSSDDESTVVVEETPEPRAEEQGSGQDNSTETRRVAQLILDGFIKDNHTWSCTAADHLEHRQIEEEEFRELFKDEDLPQYFYERTAQFDGETVNLKLPDVLAAEEALTLDDLRVDKRALEYNFEGRISSQDNEPLRVFVQDPYDYQLRENVSVSFDIDSTIAFPSSLAALKTGLQFHPAPNQMNNIKSDLHIKGTHEGRQKALKKIPHFPLGRVINAPEYIVHVFFPNMEAHEQDDGSVWMNDRNLGRFMDQLFLPALHRHTPSHINQHYPSSFAHAKANARAKTAEQGVRGQARNATVRLFYDIGACVLHNVWTSVLERIQDNTAGLADFSGLYVVVSSKNTKLRHKFRALATEQGRVPVRESLLGVMTRWREEYFTIFDENLTEDEAVFVDLAREIVPLPSFITEARWSPGRAEVLLWRRCCLEKIATEWTGRRSVRLEHINRFYHQQFLNDAVNMTSTPPKTHEFYKQGWRYSQRYNSVKEMHDAANVFPFTNPGLDELALDPVVRDACIRIIKGASRNIETIEKAYYASKKRTREALMASKHKSYGLREEHRVTLRLLDEVLSLLRCPETEDQAAARPEYHMDDIRWRPTFAWTVPTTDWTGFVYWTVNKYCFGFEYVRAMTMPAYKSWSEVKMMVMFLTCLRYSVAGGVLQARSALWLTQRQTEGRQTKHGLGFKETLSKYSIAWLASVVDWDKMRFKQEFAQSILFDSHALRKRLLKHSRLAKDFIGLVARMDVGLDFIDHMLTTHDGTPFYTVRSSPAPLEEVLTYISHVIFSEYRRSVITYNLEAIHPELRQEAQKADQPFTMKLWRRLLIREPFVIVGNSATAHPNQLFRLLFGWDDLNKKGGPLDRGKWNKKPYRLLAQRLFIFLQDRLQGKIRFWRRDVSMIMCYQFFKYHNFVNYASGTYFQSLSTGHRLRQWYITEMREVDGFETLPANFSVTKHYGSSDAHDSALSLPRVISKGWDDFDRMWQGSGETWDRRRAAEHWEERKRVVQTMPYYTRDETIQLGRP